MSAPPNKLAKILVLGPALAAVSGVSTHVAQLLRSRLQVDFDLLHFQVGGEGRVEGVVKKLVRHFLSPLSLGVELIWHGIHIVHINTSLNPRAFWRDFLYLCVVKLHRRKIVWQVHGGTLSDFVDRNMLRQIAVKTALHLSDAVVVLSESERRKYASVMSDDRLRVIPNAVELEVNAERVPKEYERTPLRLVYLGRLQREKGLFEFIEGLRILRDRRGLADICVVFRGSGPDKEALLREIEASNLADEVQVLGPVFGTEKRKFWQEACLLVFPSYREGLPYTVIEALASATPVIATRVGAIPEVIEDGVHGILVEPRRAQPLATALEQLLQDRSRLQEMSRACLSRAQEFYEIGRLESQLKRTYLEVMKKGQPV